MYLPRYRLHTQAAVQMLLLHSEVSLSKSTRFPDTSQIQMIERVRLVILPALSQALRPWIRTMAASELARRCRGAE